MASEGRHPSGSRRRWIAQSRRWENLCTILLQNNVPLNVKTGMIFAVTDVATPVYRDSLMHALRSGKLKCLSPPTIVDKGLEPINGALRKSKAGVSATKLVAEL